jgi:isoleucyl-tRNA synthetase
LSGLLGSIDFADVCITSSIALSQGAAPAGAFALPGVEGVAVAVEKAAGDKCARCWKYTPDVGQDKRHAELCARCAGVVTREMGEKAA